MNEPTPRSTASGVRIYPDQLEPETLHRVIEEFVTRDGTEFTDTSTKVRQVLELVERGEVELWFDPLSQSCNILRPTEPGDSPPTSS